MPNDNKSSFLDYKCPNPNCGGTLAGLMYYNDNNYYCLKCGQKTGKTSDYINKNPYDSSPYSNLPWRVECPFCNGKAMRLSGYNYNCENCGKIDMEGRTLKPV